MNPLQSSPPHQRTPKKNQAGDLRRGLMRAAPAQLNLLRGNNCSMDFLLFLYFLFFCFYLFPLSFIFFVFSLSPLICHLPQDLHPSIEYTQRTTQWNKSITHSITGTARPAGSGFWGEAGRKVLWLLERVLVCQRFWLNSAPCLSAALLFKPGGGTHHLFRPL